MQEKDEIRCASIMLLGNLSKFGSGEPVFKDQIHNVLVGLLLHLSDPSTQVVKVSEFLLENLPLSPAVIFLTLLNKMDIIAKIVINHACLCVCVFSGM